MVAPARCAAVMTRSENVVQMSSHPPARATGAQDLVQHGEPLVDAEHRRLAGVGADRHHEPVGEPCGLPHQVEMAVCNGVERPGEKRGPRHRGGLLRALAGRKT